MGVFFFYRSMLQYRYNVNVGGRDMSDFYTEQLIKKQTTGKDRMIKILLILLTVVSVLIIFIFPFGIILPVALIALDVFMFQRMDVEYEYLFVQREILISTRLCTKQDVRECVPSISMMWRFLHRRIREMRDSIRERRRRITHLHPEARTYMPL